MSRTKTFTVESALDKAVEVFTQRGYLNTSMEAIAVRLGLSRSSIYATFGTKHALFVQTLRHYGPTCRVLGLDELRAAAAPRDTLLHIFGTVNGHNQCLLINTAIQLENSSPVIAGILQTAFEDLEARFREAIERAKSANEIDAGVDPLHTARALIGLYLGLCVLVRSGGASEPVLHSVFRQAQMMLPPQRCDESGP
jgi:TetR/AcrR family transcriptional repressor of nem operon